MELHVGHIMNYHDYKWQIAAGFFLTYKRLAATKPSKIWFSDSATPALWPNGTVFYSVCQVWLSSGPPDVFTFRYQRAWLWKCLYDTVWWYEQSRTQSFLLRMLDENEGLWKGPILRRFWLVLWNVIQYNKSAICGLLEPVLSRALRLRRACAVRS